MLIPFESVTEKTMPELQSITLATINPIQAQSTKRQLIPVSVIIPCYNCAGTVSRAIESVMAQTTLPTEIWLVNDGSTDRTLDVLRELEKKFQSVTSMKIISLPQNSGAPVARNAGWDQARQPYIVFLDADDSWHSRKLEIQYQWMSDHPEVVMVGHRWRLANLDFTSFQLPKNWGARQIRPYWQLFSNQFSTPTVMLRRELPYRFDPTSGSEDFDLWLRIMLDKNCVWKLGLALTYLYKAPFGVSGISKHLWKLEKARLISFCRRIQEGRLNASAMILVLPWSLMKFVRRWMIVTLRNLKQRNRPVK